MKKLLALVLALVMTLGLATVAANASFPDAADIDLTEAADVMAAVGVFKGDEKGNFAPKANLDRAAAAKLIAYLSLGEKVAEALPGVQVFKDVPATHWAAKYIAYCADAGYISGAGDGNFYPSNSLTGYAFGKMVLCVLGYDAAIEGFTGSTWAINVAKLMDSNDITKGIDAAASATLTREQAAQYCLNALKADMVEYETKGTSIEINGAKIATGASKAAAKTTKSTDAKWTAIGNETGAERAIQLGEKLYDGKLTKAGATDNLGRKAVTWTYDGKKIDTYATETAKLTYTTKVTGGTLYTDLGKVTPTTVNLKVDGVAKTSAASITSGNKANAAADSTNNYSAAGVLTEVYYDSSTKTADIIVTNTYVGKIGTWKAAVTDKNGDVTTKEYVTLKTVADASVAGGAKFETTAFEKQDATDGTIVLYTLGNDGTSTAIESVVKAEKVSDVKVSSNSDTKVNSYTKAAKAENATSFTMTGSTSYDLYLDTYGNVIYAKVYSGSENDNWVYVIAVDTSVSGGDVSSETAYKGVKYLSADGKTAVVKAISVDGTDGTYPSADTWYTFEEDDEHVGYQNFKTVSTTTTDSIFAVAPTSVSKIEKSTPSLVSNLVANANTTFVLKTGSSTYKVYNGLSNLPKYTGSFNVTGVTKDGYAALVYADVTGAASDSDGSTAVYIISATSTGTGYDSATKTSYTTYDAIVDGAKTSLQVKGTPTISAGLFTLTTNTDGFVTGTTAYSGSKYTVQSGLSAAAVEFKGGVLTVNGTAYAVASDIPTYIWDTDEKELKVGTPADLVSDSVKGDFYALYKSASDTTITSLYFIGTIE